MIKKTDQKKQGFILESMKPLWLALGWSITAKYDLSGKLLYAEIKTGWGTSREALKNSALWSYCQEMGKQFV